VKEEHDNLKRRIDMEKSSVQHALGADQKDSRSKRYDEWDYMNRRYLKAWCRVYEEKLLPEENVQIDELNQVIRQYQPLVQKQLEQIRPTGLERVKRVQDGDELDFNAIIEARQDIKAGKTPDERFYSRKERTNRDVCAIFLVDLSASTDDPIKPVEPKDWSGYDPEKEIDIRAGWYSALEEEEEPAGPPERKIIDLEKEAMVVMAAALDSLGDSYGIYGFSGYSKDNVEVFVAKEPEDKFSNQTLQNIASLKPKGSTRMGPAIRHANQKLCSSGSAMKVMIMISDGFPQDCDYGPERGNHDYGVEDTAKALIEAQQKGIETFCVTVDKSDIARIVRGQTLTIKGKEFVDAAKAGGVSTFRIIFRHIVPNLMGIVVVYVALTVPQVILVESFLSFLGLGVQEPMTSWGALVNQGARQMESSPWILLFPALFLAVTLFCFNFIGDGLRDALDPKDRTNRNE
jgi:hypothetical protein